MAPRNIRISPPVSDEPQGGNGHEERFVHRQGFSEDVTDEQARRIRECKKDIQIEHAFFEESLRKMSLVLSAAGNSKPKGLMIIGDSDSGKSTLLRAFCTRLEEAEQRLYGGERVKLEQRYTPLEEYAVKPAFMFSIPSSATVNGILERALMLNGITPRGRMTLTQLENLLYEKLRLLKTRVILIDEFHDIARIGYKQQEDVLKVIKEMTNNLSIPIIATGTREVEPILESDEQIYTRLSKIYLHAFQPDNHFIDFLLHYKKARIQLRHDVDFSDKILVGYIHNLTNGLAGQVTQLLSIATERAILTGEERITLALLKEIAFKPVNTALSSYEKNPYKI